MRNVISFLLILIASTVLAQEDSTFVPVVDSVDIIIKDDTSHPDDTLSEAQRKLKEFEQRQQEFKHEKAKERLPLLSYYDSLYISMLPNRLNYQEQIAQSTYRNAGDYLKFNPSFFVVDHQITPMRTTARPFGLSGNRLSLIYNGYNQNPFEHIIEPDGMIDLNDIPTSLNDKIAVISGGAGRIFGGGHSAASVITVPNRPTDFDPHSAMIVDQGSFGYSYTRGRYSKLFSSGKELDFSIGYRDADGVTLIGRDDDTYNYSVRSVLPFKKDYSLNVAGQLYRRKGSFVIHPLIIGSSLRRNRFDKSIQLSLDRYNLYHNAKTQIGFRYNHNNSNLDGTNIGSYKGRFDLNGYDLFLAREWIGSGLIFRLEFTSMYNKYRNGYSLYERYSAKADFNLADTKGSTTWALAVGSEYAESFGLLPYFSYMINKDSENLFYSLNLSYSGRAPSMHELFLPQSESVLYSGSAIDYFEQGNSELEKENQLIASGTVEFGSSIKNIRLSITGGKIFDGIEWENRVDQIGAARTGTFSPINSDITFADFQLRPTITFGDWLKLHVGGTYHYIDYTAFDDKAYSPDFQFYSGSELHWYWKQKFIHFYAYSELVYSSEYKGYNGAILGNNTIANVKLSFQMKSFRFHYLFVNSLTTVYSPYENYPISSRLQYYGFVWNFFD